MPIIHFGDDGELDLHPSGPRAWDGDEANEWADYTNTVVTGTDARFEAIEDDTAYLNARRPGTDFRDLQSFAVSGTVGTGNSGVDTAALQAAVAWMTSSSTSTDDQPKRLYIPRGRYLLASPLTLYGSVSTSGSWVGEQGRSKGPDGTEIKWVGDDKAVMLHCLGLNGFDFENIAFNANQKARFCVWVETNQRNGGSPSSDVKFSNCTFTSFGYYGVGLVIGDEVRATMPVGSITGSFQAGDYVISSNATGLVDGIATVVSLAAGTLSLKEIIGDFSSNPYTITNKSRAGSCATTGSWTINPDYQGSRQASELICDHCHFIGIGAHDTTARSGWAGWATFGANNNKNFTLRSPRFYGTRYAIDWYWGSGYLEVDGGINVSVHGHEGVGAICRAGGGNLEWRGANFENGDPTMACHYFDLSNCIANINGGDYFGVISSDNHAIRTTYSTVNLNGIKLGADTGIAKILMNGGTMNLNGVGWREDFSGYLPIIDSSGNPLGGNPQGTDSDYSRNNDIRIFARNCTANWQNAFAALRYLPNFDGVLPSPQRAQLWDDGLGTTKYSIIRRGTTNRVVEQRRVTYSNVIAGSGTCDFAKTRLKSIIHWIVADVTTTFRGGALSDMDLEVGDDTDPDRYILISDIYTATAQYGNDLSERGVGLVTPVTIDATPRYFPKECFQPFDAYRTLKATFTATGAAVSALTQGQLDLYICYEVL